MSLCCITSRNRIIPFGTVFITCNKNINPNNNFGGSWTLISDRLPIGENIFGNGKVIGFGFGLDNSSVGTLGQYGSAYMAQHIAVSDLGKQAGSTTGLTSQEKTIGIVTKSQLNNNNLSLSYSGIICDSIEAYIWIKISN